MPLEVIAPRSGVSLGRALLSVPLLLAGLAIQARPSGAASAFQTFGPGQVNCQALTGTHVDCLLAASRVTQDNSNVATFSVASLPHGEQALFLKWCVPTANACIVTVKGRRATAQSTRLMTVTAVRWTRLSPPENQAAARAAKPATVNTSGVGSPPAQ